MTLLRRTVAEGSTLERWLRRKAAIGNITKGDSLYLCGHGETAPLTGLIFLPDLGRFGTPEAASFVTCIDGSRGRADATLGSSRCVLTMPLCPAQAKMRWVYWTLAGSHGDTSLAVQDHDPSVAQTSIAWRVGKDAVTKRLGRRHQLRVKSPACGQVSGARLSQPVHR